jgi:hypothetical protein
MLHGLLQTIPYSEPHQIRMEVTIIIQKETCDWNRLFEVSKYFLDFIFHCGRYIIKINTKNCYFNDFQYNSNSIIKKLK